MTLIDLDSVALWWKTCKRDFITGLPHNLRPWKIGEFGINVLRLGESGEFHGQVLKFVYSVFSLGKLWQKLYFLIFGGIRCKHELTIKLGYHITFIIFDEITKGKLGLKSLYTIQYIN